MTTFQALIDAFIQALIHLLPISEPGPTLLIDTVLHWPPAIAEIVGLVSLMGAIAFLIFFRFDWLGMISAVLKSITQPMSLKSETRTLDQHTLIFLILTFLPSFLVRLFLSPHLKEIEILQHPFFYAFLSLLLAYGFHFAQGWNKRIHGLNHLRLEHGLFIGLLAIFSVHPILPFIGLLWIGFALFNYHYEAIFKYSMLALGLNLICESIVFLKEIGLKESLVAIGHLNAVAMVVVSFTVFWMGLENLQKNLSESTYRSFRWVSALFSVFFIALYFIK